MAESQFQISAILSVGEANASFVTWNSGTAGGATAQLVNADYSYNTLNVTLAQTTTITGGVLTFQGSTDGVNWISLEGFNASTGATVGPTYTLTASTYIVISFNLTAMPYFQVLLSTAITGTGAVTVGYAADSFVNEMTSSNSSVGANGNPIPGDSTLIGFENAGLNLVPVSPSNPLPVTFASSSVGNAPTIVAIGTSSTSVLAANTNRKGVNLVNMSYETISLAFGANPAVLFSGVNLGPGGTFWMDAADFTTAAISAISTLTAAGGYLGVQEFQ